ncbi:MAG: hypothetical protein B7O98_04510 [Zestosphaera tikiterensis]|uniref:Uncharacterized protein n=1 Tax=Zestosphaera tikiterensis TaxID=1973259 RepID=A0A2R7Y811_9CREN|nr:MAG: hypothetical protein B7O98_04510 [Zestosphaera tikiterensis]
MRGGGLTSKVKMLYVLACVSATFLGLTLITSVVTPIYRFHGVVEGEVALSWYLLSYYDEVVRVASLDAVRVLTIPLFILSTFLIASSAYALLTYVFKKFNSLLSAAELLLGGGLASITMSTLLLSIVRILTTEVSGLSVDNVFYTSAGLVNFGRTYYYVNSLTSTLLNPLTVMALNTINALLAGATYVLLTSEVGTQEEGSS